MGRAYVRQGDVRNQYTCSSKDVKGTDYVGHLQADDGKYVETMWTGTLGLMAYL
jgi:hypothetical protein